MSADCPQKRKKNAASAASQQEKINSHTHQDGVPTIDKVLKKKKAPWKHL